MMGTTSLTLGSSPFSENGGRAKNNQRGRDREVQKSGIVRREGKSSIQGVNLTRVKIRALCRRQRH